jgi:hypothetical protein
VLDFYCPQLKLAVEVDGDSHFQTGAPEYDQSRQCYIESLGIRFLRFTNSAVLAHLDEVVEQIAVMVQALAARSNPLSISPFARGRLVLTPSQSPPSQGGDLCWSSQNLLYGEGDFIDSPSATRRATIRVERRSGKSAVCPIFFGVLCGAGRATFERQGDITISSMQPLHGRQEPT